MKPHEKLEHEAEKLLCPGMYPVSCSSGTAALHLACEVMEIESEYQEVLVPNFAMVACARAVSLATMEPLFVDVKDDGLISPWHVHDAIDNAYDGVGNSNWKPGRKIVGAVVVNTYGRRYDVFSFRKATESYNLFLIEDMAECHGVPPSYNADAACWSFYKNKIVAGEEGGLVAFRDKNHADHARKLRCLGFTEDHDFNHIPRGHNYRLADCLAEKILDNRGNRWGCLYEMGENLHRRRDVESFYQEKCPSEWKMPKRDVVWVYDLRIPDMTTDKQNFLVKSLRSQGIEARHGFKPLSRQEEYREKFYDSHPQYDIRNPVASRLSREVIYLPVHPSMTRKQCHEIMNTLLSLEEEYTDTQGRL